MCAGALRKNSNTPVTVLELLSKDSDAYVRRGVAQNPNTPVTVLELSLSKDSDAYVRWGGAQEPQHARHRA